jgi:GntR family transcriptional regulator, rspAB operon transcriptional repressor
MRAPENPAAAATLAYDEVKRRIIELEYEPGAKLSEARLVDELGHGRSPIRTAFSRLQAEGWIAVSPQSGTYVRSLSEKEIGDIFETRLLLETHVTRTAAANMDAERLRKLRVAFRRLAPHGKAFESDIFDDFNELDSMFHSSIYEAAGNTLITAILLNLLEKVRWIKKSFPSTPKRMKLSFAELERVLESLEDRDPEKAAQRMREHIGNAADFAADVRKQRAVRKQKAA